jgi:DNA-binding MarR family transcriptional regulator
MTHLRVLWQLEEHGELGMSGLSDLLGVSMSNATGLVDRMEERGLIERVRPTDDRRAVHVRPTARGIELAHTIEVLRGDLMEEVLGRLDDEQLERLARSVEDIRSVVLAEPLDVAAACAPPAHDPPDAERLDPGQSPTRPTPSLS